MTQKYIPQYLQEIVDLLKDIKKEIAKEKKTKIEKATAKLQADIEYREGDKPKKETAKKSE